MLIQDYIIFETKNCKVEESLVPGMFEVQLFGKRNQLRWCQLITLFTKIKNIDLSNLLLSDDIDDFEIFFLRGIDEIMVLTLTESIELKRLSEGFFSMLNLHKDIALALKFA